MPTFICPGCGAREAAGERQFGHQPRGCSRCGFGFLFELLEDYYPGPLTALISCDRDRRIIAGGKNSAAVTGYREPDLLGHDVVQKLRLGGFDGRDPIETSLEWGVRVMGAACTFTPKGVGDPRPATLDVFPAYDDDGGLLVALTPLAGGR